MEGNPISRRTFTRHAVRSLALQDLTHARVESFITPPTLLCLLLKIGEGAPMGASRGDSTVVTFERLNGLLPRSEHKDSRFRQPIYGN